VYISCADQAVRILPPLIARHSIVCCLLLPSLHVALGACQQELALDVVLEEPLAAASASTLSVARYTIHSMNYATNDNFNN
jgi:hypothetical protein